MKKLLFLLISMAVVVYGCKKSDPTSTATANPYDPSKAWTWDTLIVNGHSVGFHSTNPVMTSVLRNFVTYDTFSVNEQIDTTSISYKIAVNNTTSILLTVTTPHQTKTYTNMTGYFGNPIKNNYSEYSGSFSTTGIVFNPVMNIP